MKSKFDEKLEQAWENQELKRIRIKRDPKNPDDSYEGYYIKEDEQGQIMVYVPNQEDPYQTVDSCEPYICPKIQKLKKFGLLYMIKKGIVSKDDPDLEKYITIDSMSCFEDFIRSKFMGDPDILEIYRIYIENE